MAKVQSTIGFASGIDSVSRKFVPRKETCGEKTVGKKKFGALKWFGSSVRTNWAAGYGSYQINAFVVRRNKRATVASTEELTNRSHFSASSTATSEITLDLGQIGRVNNMWKQAKVDFTKHVSGVSARGYNRNGWIFAICMARLKDGASMSDIKTFPLSFDA